MTKITVRCERRQAFVEIAPFLTSGTKMAAGVKLIFISIVKKTSQQLCKQSDLIGISRRIVWLGLGTKYIFAALVNDLQHVAGGQSLQVTTLWHHCVKDACTFVSTSFSILFWNFSIKKSKVLSNSKLIFDIFNFCAKHKFAPQVANWSEDVGTRSLKMLQVEQFIWI